MWKSKQEEKQQLDLHSSVLLSGSRQAINDFFEAYSDAEKEFIQWLDAALRAQGLITFSELRRHYSKRYHRILKRGKINNEEEYYLIIGVLADTTFPATDADRMKLESMISIYEAPCRSSSSSS